VPLVPSTQHSRHSPPLHSFIPGLKPFLQILPTVDFLFFFRTDFTDSANCLPILLSVSVFTFQFILFPLFSCWFRAVDYADTLKEHLVLYRMRAVSRRSKVAVDRQISKDVHRNRIPNDPVRMGTQICQNGNVNGTSTRDNGNENSYFFMCAKIRISRLDANTAYFLTAICDISLYVEHNMTMTVQDSELRF